MAASLLEKVKHNLILTHSEDDELLEHMVAAATSYAASYQHLPDGYYAGHPMSGATQQAIIMLASHFYESRDGSTAGFWNDKPGEASSVWDAVNRLLVMDREWKI
ncbi:head-tail connector protein [Trueperella pyogenes]|uniref:head-tail connector protein n=1 Tax=Trueperella pyogenes TaxID=1661 RepID=UPI000D52A981|nr:head-tail connector protein [Trueperella pyogenes]AWG03425.1 phage gp6-like head-tail connector protein [Trueperella pyogenes]AWG16156.1 phage gp6-like head-tail connector protein [Trueperella pyogenes]AZR05039.1 phage gp6-like head-tail connector protein [Trueperella pyogenes]